MANMQKITATMQYVREHPEEYRQDHWIQKSESCGTACCFAGWACLLNGWTIHNKTYGYVEKEGVIYSVRHAAVQELEITYEDAAVMFDGSRTVEELQACCDALAEGRNLWKLLHEWHRNAS